MAAPTTPTPSPKKPEAAGAAGASAAKPGKLAGKSPAKKRPGHAHSHGNGNFLSGLRGMAGGPEQGAARQVDKDTIKLERLDGLTVNTKGKALGPR